MGDPVDPFGPTLRRLREQAGLTQEELAERAGISANAIRALENGRRRRPYPHTVRALTAALGLDGEAATTLEAARRSPERPGAGLPAPRSRLIGREREVAEVARDLLDGRTRLITLIGPGGVGKTRLALEVARELTPQVRDGVALALLAPLRDPDLVPHAIAQGLDVRELGAVPVMEALRLYLRNRRVVLVADNFEHVLEAATDVGRLLDAAPGLTVLATSRSPLQLQGEHVRPLSPLGAAPAVDLFAERVAQAGGTAAADRDVARAICERLDRLPLAIELAAARTRLLPAPALLGQLERGLDVLGGGARDLPERQQTLRATIAWSYDLLGPAEQALLRRLAVFAGGWTPEAAAAVAEADYETVLELHAGLLDASLIGRRPDEGEPRFGLLETVRAFALERLEASGELERARDRHAGHFHALVSPAWDGLWSPRQPVWLDRLDRDMDNLRVAVRRLLDTGDVERVAHLVYLFPFWSIRGHFLECRRWVLEALATPGASTNARSRLLLLWGYLLFCEGRYQPAVAGLDEALTLARRSGEHVVLTFGLCLRGILDGAMGSAEVARVVVEEAEALAAELGLEIALPSAWQVRAYIALVEGRPADAERFLAEREAHTRTYGAPWELAVALNFRALAALHLGDFAKAERLMGQAFPILERLDDRWAVLHSLTVTACAAGLGGQPEKAARLFGALAALGERVGASVIGQYEQFAPPARAAATAEIGRERFDALVEEGARLTHAQVVALAMSGSAGGARGEMGEDGARQEER